MKFQIKFSIFARFQSLKFTFFNAITGNSVLYFCCGTASYSYTVRWTTCNKRDFGRKVSLYNLCLK